jgi:hypothetical protein
VDAPRYRHSRERRQALGPKGRNVVLSKSFGAPRITKDGATVAKDQPPDPIPERLNITSLQPATLYGDA